MPISAKFRRAIVPDDVPNEVWRMLLAPPKPSCGIRRSGEWLSEADAAAFQAAHMKIWRRMEEAIMIQTCGATRLSLAGVPWLRNFRDSVNAFASADHTFGHTSTPSSGLLSIGVTTNFSVPPFRLLIAPHSPLPAFSASCFSFPSGSMLTLCNKLKFELEMDLTENYEL